MKKLLSIAMILASMFLISQTLQAQCPFGGKVNCKGECGRFTDENADGYCDFAVLEQSEPAPQAEEALTNEQQTSKSKVNANLKEQNQVGKKSHDKTQVSDLPEQTQSEQTQTFAEEPQNETFTETIEHPLPKALQTYHNHRSVSCSLPADICLGKVRQDEKAHSSKDLEQRFADNLLGILHFRICFGIANQLSLCNGNNEGHFETARRVRNSHDCRCTFPYRLALKILQKHI